MEAFFHIVNGWFWALVDWIAYVCDLDLTFTTGTEENRLKYLWTAMLGGSLLALVSIVFEEIRKHRHSRGIATMLTVVVALIASLWTYMLLIVPEHKLTGTVLFFLVSLCLWALSFHIFALNFGREITLWLRRWPKLAGNWVKAIDYLYLSLSTFSIIRIVVSAVVKDGNDYFNALGAVLLGFAVALRITKTSIEIFGWDRPAPADPIPPNSARIDGDDRAA